MHLDQSIDGFEAAVETQLRVAGAEAAEMGGQLMAALRPALRQSFLDLVSMAAAEVSGQLVDQRVEVRLVEGDPELLVSSDPSQQPPPPPVPPGLEDDDARITLRLPAHLKDLITEAAATSGDSVNAFVVDALRSKASTAQRAGKTRLITTIDL